MNRRDKEADEESWKIKQKAASEECEKWVEIDK